MGKRNSKQKNRFYLTFFILLLNIISIAFLPNTKFEVKNYEDIEDDSNLLIHTSSNGPSNRHFFKYYKVITIDNNKVSGTGSHKNFPLLISILDSDLHEDVQSNGNDIAFANDTDWLDHEMELFNQTYNSTHAKLIVWVRIPNLSTSIDTQIRMYYGNSTMGARENPTGVWDDNYEFVLHMNQDPTSSDILDSTSNGFDFDVEVSGSMTSDDLVNGQTGKALAFDGVDDYIFLPVSEGFSGPIEKMTFEFWVMLPDGGPPPSRDYLGAPATASAHPYLSFYDDSFEFKIATVTPDSEVLNSGQTTFNAGTWYHFSAVWDGTGAGLHRIYINGSIDSEDLSVKLGNHVAWNTFSIGAEDDDADGPGGSGGSREIKATLSEFRLSKVVRSAEWIATEYENQNDPNSFYSIGNANSISGHPPNAHYFSNYKEIIIDHTKVSGQTDLLNFPVLLSCFDKDLHENVLQSNGNDIAFSDGVSWLYHEIEFFNKSYNNTHAQLVAWVRIPRLLTSLDTIIRMYYGNSTISSLENPTGVWDDNYIGIWHLSEDPTGTVYDSTTNNNDGSSYGSMDSGDQIVGKIDGSINFDGNDDNIATEENNYLAGCSSLTMSAWIKPLSTQSDFCGIIEYDNNTDGSSFDAGMELRSTRLPRVNVWTTSGFKYVDSSVVLPTTQFTYFVFVYDGDLNIYLNGSFDSSTSHSGNVRNNHRFINIGRNTHDGRSFNGIIDEARISNINRSADWISTEYNNQYDPVNFYSIGKEYPVSGLPSYEHYFGYYKKITIDNAMVSGSHELINFPLLISILDEDLYSKVQEDGDDIAFTYNGAWLDHEIELFDQDYNGTHAQLIAWISLPRLSTSENTVIRMYYGNSTMNSRQNPSKVWTKNYKGVWHLKEDPSGPTPQFSDSTAYNNDGTAVNLFSSNQTSGKIDGGLIFNDENEACVNVSDDNSLDLNSDMTISAWVKTSDNEPDVDIVITKWSSNPPNQNYWFGKLNSNDFAFYVDSTQNVLMNLNLVNDNNWHYVVGVADSTNSLLRIYLDGVQRNTAAYSGSSQTGTHFLNIGRSSGIIEQEWNGKIDEVRVLNTVRSADWLATEFDNQNDPQFFLTMGPEEKIDNTPPTYSNLIESSNPLELGDTEIITINVSDPSGISQVRLEIEDANYSMSNIGGNTWQNDSWTPSSVGNYSYTIWMEDNFNNWNFTMGTIEVIDTTPPSYSNLIESQDPIQSGKNETIEINVYDLSGVNQTLLEYESTNHSMVFQGGNKWSWSKWQPTLPFNPYKIYMQDNQDNWNVVSGNITVITTTAPIIENLTEIEDPLELGNNFIVQIDVKSNESMVDTVLIELDGINRTMSNVSGNTYEYIWNSSEYIESGYSVGIPINYIIYANDSNNNWALQYQASFEIKDTIGPTFSALSESAEELELGDIETITINCTDLAGINEVRIEFETLNELMINLGGNKWLYNWTPSSVGNKSYTIWAKDNNTNWNFISNSIIVQDTTPPVYSDLTESAKIVELGTTLTISVKATDLADIKEVLIEYENSNHSMAYIGEDIWDCDFWIPNSIGNYSYKIFIRDNNENLANLSSWILFEDNIDPIYSNLAETADPLELGDNQIIRIDIYDFAGINRTLIEFEGANHSMTKIFMTNTWQYNLWTPNNWIVYQYRIHIEDNSGNWNNVVGNFTVQDTTPPPSPILTNSPSGDVSGKLVFDWSDGVDPSGISFYILIIDNETNPLATPGYVYIFNITNTGPGSSYCELPEILPPGEYYFFLAQVDGVGQQGSYTMGTFTVIENGTPGNNIFLIIGIILVSAIGSVSAIILIRRKLKKDIVPSRKKIPFKIISSHINKLSSTQVTLDSEEIQTMTDEKEIAIQINEIKHMGEELFAEGAYLEAQKQFMLGRDLLTNLGREDEAKLFSDLISGIEGLIVEREKRLEILEKVKIEGNSVQVFEIYHEIIAISKKLRDPDTASFYQSELINYFQNNLNFVDLENYRYELNQKAGSLIENNIFEIAAQLFEKCENISQLFVQIGKEEEIINIQEFKRKKEDCLKSLK